MAGNSIRCVGKYLYDNRLVKKTVLTIETTSGIRKLKLYTSNDQVTTVTVEVGQANLDPKSLPCIIEEERLVDYPIEIGGKTGTAQVSDTKSDNGVMTAFAPFAATSLTSTPTRSKTARRPPM